MLRAPDLSVFINTSRNDSRQIMAYPGILIVFKQLAQQGGVLNGGIVGTDIQT